jgi:hypothetical protein
MLLNLNLILLNLNSIFFVIIFLYINFWAFISPTLSCGWFFHIRHSNFFQFDLFFSLSPNYSNLIIISQLPLDSTAFSQWFYFLSCTLCHKFSRKVQELIIFSNVWSNSCLDDFLSFLLAISHKLHNYIAYRVLLCVVVHFKTPENAKTVPIFTKFNEPDFD